MFKNYLITAFKNLIKNKLFSLINIIGLAIGISAFILILVFVRHENSFDKHWQDVDRLFLMTQELSFPPGSEPRRLSDFTSMFSPAAIDVFFENEFEVSAMTMPIGQRFRIGDVTYEGGVKRSESSILDMFQFETLSGDLPSTFLNPDSIALSEKQAEILFGSASPIGELVSVENDSFRPGEDRSVVTTDYTVSAVYRLAEGNTVLDIPAMVLLEERPVALEQGFFVRLEGAQYFVKLNSGVLPEYINNSLRDFVEQNGSPFLRNFPTDSPLDIVTLQLEPLNEHYFDPLPGLNKQGTGNKDAVRIYSAVSVLVLLIGCLNFVILSTAKSTQRAKEVALRKVIGAKPIQLVWQFLGESLILTMLAIVLAIGLMLLVLPFFENFLNLTLPLKFGSLETWLFILALLISVAFLGGLYPAIVMSSFSPKRALRSNQAELSEGSIRLRSVLVVLQFAISIALIVATLIVYAQLAFIKINPGYNPDNLIVMRSRLGISISDGEISYTGIANVDTLKQEILSLPEVTAAAITGLKPNESMGFSTNIRTAGADGQDPVSAQMPANNIGYDFFSTYQIPLVAGRFFDPSIDQEIPFSIQFAGGPDRPRIQTKILINEAAVRQLQFSSPEAALGQTVFVGTNNADAEIIGIVADTRYTDIRQEPTASAYQLNSALSNHMTVRFQGSIQNITEKLESIWAQLAGELEFNSNIVQQDIDEAFTDEENLGKVFMLLSLLAVFISAMGLYGMASFTVDRRVKEIGIRKVMGATEKRIVLLLLTQFSLPVLLSCILAWPAILYLIQDWLAGFPFQIEFTTQIAFCFLAGFTALILACLTVAGNTFHVAKSNPLESLRYE